MNSQVDTRNTLKRVGGPKTCLNTFVVSSVEFIRCGDAAPGVGRPGPAHPPRKQKNPPLLAILLSSGGRTGSLEGADGDGDLPQSGPAGAAAQLVFALWWRRLCITTRSSRSMGRLEFALAPRRRRPKPKSTIAPLSLIMALPQPILIQPLHLLGPGLQAGLGLGPLNPCRLIVAGLVIHEVQRRCIIMGL